MPTDPLLVLDVEDLRDLTMNDRNLMGEILSALVEDARRHSEMLAIAARELDHDRAAKIARSASRACSHLGANAIANAFREVERLASLHDSDWQSTLTSVHTEIESLQTEVRRL